jgi:Flp pilus assembly pilin Flp
MRQVMKRAGADRPGAFQRRGTDSWTTDKRTPVPSSGECMRRAAARLVREESAQDLIEYALLSALLAIACITGILQLTGIREFFAMVGRALADAL